MGKAEIALIDVTNEVLSKENGQWTEMCQRVREASENHGCFLVKNETISSTLFHNLFQPVKSLFDLPEETKLKYTNPKPYRSYTSNCTYVPLIQSFGLDHPHLPHVVRSFTDLMWPDGNSSFCESVHVMSSKMLELNFLVLKLIYDSFGLEKYYELHVKDSENLLRIMKYVAPVSGDDGGRSSVVALPAHTDKNLVTVLCQNQVQGLEVETKDGGWAQVFVPQDALVVIVGEALKVWSNGRLKAPRHRVVMKVGNEDRYSCGLFTMPKEESIIEVPPELVDSDHPLLYRPFIFSDYISFYVSHLTDDALDIYASVSP